MFVFAFPLPQPQPQPVLVYYEAEDYRVKRRYEVRWVVTVRFERIGKKWMQWRYVVHAWV